MHQISLKHTIHTGINHAIYLGAGHGHELPALLELNAEKLFLVEGDEAHQELLEHEVLAYPQARVIKKLLSDKTGSATFYRYSLSELNSLQEGIGLQQLFPNVRLVEQQTLQTESLVEWLNTLPLVQCNNLLWIDLPGQEAIIIQHLIEHQKLDLFDMLILYVHQQPCYEGQQSIAQIREMLADQGYEVQQQNNDFDPDRPLLILKRHALYWANKELNTKLQATITKLQTELADAKEFAQASTEKQQQLEKQLSETQQSAKVRQEKVTALEAQLVEAQKTAVTNKEVINKIKAELEEKIKESQAFNEKLNQISEEKDKLNIHFQNRKKQAEEGELKIQSLNEENNTLKEENTALTKRRNELKKQLEEAQQKVQLLETQLNAGKETQHGLSELQKQMEYLFNQNRLQLEQAANALGQHITHTGKQTAQELQTFVQCQQTLGQNTQALHYQDQSLSPEFALYLNQKLTHGYYDVILVMGSGVLTQFVATQLQQGLQQHPRLGHQEPSSDQGYVMPDQGDLPKRILAFEHKKSDSKDLKKHLQQNGYQTWVNVSHAPLVECRFSGKDYLYYDLRKPLSRLADVYEERHAKILILVSPSQVSESLTTEACLPALLQELSMHQLELVLHPVNKHIESLKSAWQSLLDSRDLEYTWVEDTHINAAQLTVNP